MQVFLRDMYLTKLHKTVMQPLIHQPIGKWELKLVK